MLGTILSVLLISFVNPYRVDATTPVLQLGEAGIQRSRLACSS